MVQIRIKKRNKMNSILLKFSCLLFFLYSFQPFSYAQTLLNNDTIYINFSNIHITEALKLIEKQVDYSFTYDASLFTEDNKINLTLKNESLDKVIDTLLSPLMLYYTQIGKFIILKKKSGFVSEKQLKDSTFYMHELRGRIKSAENGEAVPFAYVRVENYSIGTLANVNGEFVLKIPSFLLKQKVIISHIGFSNYSISVDVNKNNEVDIFLQTVFIPIQEIIIRNTDAKFLLKEALKNISVNYSQIPVYLTSFYRESVLRNNEYMFFSEAVLKQYKSPYKQTTSKDLIKVLKSRKMKNLSLKDTLVLKVKSGLETILILDIIKNKPDFLDENNFDIYCFNMVDIVSYDDKTCYAIDFEPQNTNKEALYMGTIYIDTENLAIIGLEFSINPEIISGVHKNFIVKKTKGMNVRLMAADYSVRYRRLNENYYLNHVKAELKFRVRRKKKILPMLFTTHIEMATSNIDTTNVVRFNRKEIENTNEIFSDIPYTYDETFWEDYNFIKPEENWENALQKINQKLKKEHEQNMPGDEN